MFGRESRLPVDVSFGLNNGAEQKTMSKYVEDLRQKLKKSYEIASSTTDKAQGRQKRMYDTNGRESFYIKGIEFLRRY